MRRDGISSSLRGVSDGTLGGALASLSKAVSAVSNELHSWVARWIPFRWCRSAIMRWAWSGARGMCPDEDHPRGAGVSGIILGSYMRDVAVIGVVVVQSSLALLREGVEVANLERVSALV